MNRKRITGIALLMLPVAVLSGVMFYILGLKAFIWVGVVGAIAGIFACVLYGSKLLHDSYYED